MMYPIGVQILYPGGVHMLCPIRVQMMYPIGVHIMYLIGVQMMRYRIGVQMLCPDGVQIYPYGVQMLIQRRRPNESEDKRRFSSLPYKLKGLFCVLFCTTLL